MASREPYGASHQPQPSPWKLSIVTESYRRVREGNRYADILPSADTFLS